MTVLATITLWLTPLLALWSVLVGLLGIRNRRGALLESSRRAAMVQVVLFGLVAFCLVLALARRDFSVAYVADHSSRNLDLALTGSALTAGWNGMLLAAVLVYALLMVPGLWAERSHGTAGVAVVASGLVLLASVAMIAFGNPFAHVAATPLDGHGLSPRLRDVTFLFESPFAILGWASLAAGATPVIAHRVSPASGTFDSARIGRWLGASWIASTASLTLCAWHAYGMVGSAGSPDWGRAREVTLLLWVVSGIALGAVLLGRRRWSRGVVIVAVGKTLVIAGLWGWYGGPERDLRMKSGGVATVTSPFGASYVLTHMGVSRFETPDRIVVASTLDLDRNGVPAGLVTSERRRYFNMLGQTIGDAVTTVGVRHGVLEDVRAVVVESSTDEQAHYRVRVSPLVVLLWLGAGLMMLGGVVVFAELST